MKSGIYKIVNNINGHIYIGSAVNYKSRFRTHLSLLKKEKHHSIYLQRSWNKYGENNFSFELIENCKIENLIEREQFYMDELNPEYNVCKIAGSTLGIKGTVESNKKKSENHFRKGKFGKDNPSSKLIYQYSLEGNLLRIWNGACEIERELSFHASNIRNSIKNKWTLYGFYWTNKNEGKYREPVNRRDRSKTKKSILQLTVKGEFIKEWSSAKDATTFLGKSDGSLNKCLKEKAKTAYGFKWEYKK